MPGYGEVIGVPEALWIWFGTDYAEATKVLNATPRNSKELARKGDVYRQILSLLLSERQARDLEKVILESCHDILGEFS